jgi:hypothetical protein
LDRELIIAIAGVIASIFGSGGMVAWINSRANQPVTVATAEKTNVEADTTLANMALQMVRDNQASTKATLDNLIGPLNTRINQLETEADARANRHSKAINELRAELAAQDAAIEELNTKYLKMELGFILNEYQIRGKGYEPVVPLKKLHSFDADQLRLMAEGVRNTAERTIQAKERKARQERKDSEAAE